MGCYGSSGENETRAGAKTAARLFPAVAQNRSLHGKFLFLAGAGLFGFPPCAPLPDLGSRRGSSGANPPCPAARRRACCPSAPCSATSSPTPRSAFHQGFPSGLGCFSSPSNPSQHRQPHLGCAHATAHRSRQGSAPSLREMPPKTSHSLGLIFAAPSSASSSHFTMQGWCLPTPRGPQPERRAVTTGQWWQPSRWARGPWPDLRASSWLRVGFLGGRSYLAL